MAPAWSFKVADESTGSRCKSRLRLSAAMLGAAVAAAARQDGERQDCQSFTRHESSCPGSVSRERARSNRPPEGNSGATSAVRRALTLLDSEPGSRGRFARDRPSAAVLAAHTPLARAAQPRGREPHVPVLEHRRLRRRLAPGPPRKPGRGRGRAGHDRSHRRDARGPDFRRRSRHLEGRARRAAAPLRAVRPRARRGGRHSAGSCRPQGERHAAVGGRRAGARGARRLADPGPERSSLPLGRPGAPRAGPRGDRRRGGRRSPPPRAGRWPPAFR